jgi:hypothetical protein
MKRRTIVLLSLVLFAPTSFGQSVNRSRPDGFLALILNETTSKDAIDSLGQPASDKVDRLEVSKIAKWLDPKHKEKIFRQLTFKKVKGFRSIELSFLDDRLVMIEVEFGKNLAPDKLEDTFAVGFAPVGGPADLPDTPGQYPAEFHPTFYPDPFVLVGISRRALANCHASPNGVPIGVTRTRQMSRTLEKQ